MEPKKLNEIIRDKNEQLERSALRSAEQLIEEIVTEQAKISRSTERINSLREQLTALEVQQIDPKVVLGGV